LSIIVFFGYAYEAHKERKLHKLNMLINKIALALVIIGALNWGLVGLFSFDLVAWIGGGTGSILARIIYVIVALAGIWCITLLFHRDEDTVEHHA